MIENRSAYPVIENEPAYPMIENRLAYQENENESNWFILTNDLKRISFTNAA